MKFHINEPAADRWVAHMRAAMTEVDIPEQARVPMYEFFVDVAHFLVNRPPRWSRLSTREVSTFSA